MGSAGSARGKRLEAVREKTEAAIDWRLRWREQVAACALIRAALEEAGIDPAEISCLRLGPDAARMLENRGETPEREAADAAYAAEFLSDRKSLAAKAAEQAPRWAAGGTPLPWDSFLDWLAWATVQKSLSRTAGEGEPAAAAAGG